MAANQSINGNMRDNFGVKVGITTGTPSLSDLEKAYFSGSNRSRTDGIRAFLQAQTGLTTMQSLGDLWRQYFIAKGITNQVSLGDMARAYFSTATLP